MFSGERLARDLDASLNDEREMFLRDTLAGLSAPRKTLKPKYFYDDAGSALFEAICETPGYYPTHTDTALLKAIAVELVAEIPDGSVFQHSCVGYITAFSHRGIQGRFSHSPK
jgi:uncharacterized SAM-dependent methyltransferase